MTIMREAAPAHATLDEAQAEVIRATLPLVGANIDAITTCFYGRMFGAQPALLRNLFNRGNQAQGAQQRALAGSIATYAKHLVDSDLPHPAELLSRIGHKHASLGITADQYSIVHEHLFAAIVEVLGADTVTADVAAAWNEVYWLMADTLIDLERQLYADAGVAAGDVYFRGRVTGRVDDPAGVVLVTVAVDDPRFTEHAAGQYVSVGITLPDGARQLRQYSLVDAPGGAAVTFACKPVAATDAAPAGEVSNWIAAHLRVGDVIDITRAFGDLPTDRLGTRPVTLISAGIGITPMIGILEQLARVAPDCAALVLHADQSIGTHPLRARQAELVDALPNASAAVWYSDPSGATGDVRPGFMDLTDVHIDTDSDVYLCGSNGFVCSVRDQLIAAGVPAQRLHCELFSPNDWLLS